MPGILEYIKVVTPSAGGYEHTTFDDLMATSEDFKDAIVFVRVYTDYGIQLINIRQYASEFGKEAALQLLKGDVPHET